MNIKKEFHSHLETIKKNDKDVKCSIIKFVSYPNSSLKIILNPNYSEDEYNNFLKQLNIEYNDGFGTREVFGYIWYNDDTWSERRDYDGDEWWSYKKCPSFNDKLIINIVEEGED